MKIIIFGGGNIGRGFLLHVFKGNEITFVDISQENIDLINQNELSIDIIETNEHINLGQYKAISLNNNKLNNYLAEANLILTAVGVNNLQGIAHKIDTNIFKEKIICCCENGIRISTKFKNYFPETIQEQNSFVDVVVDRIIPRQKLNKNLLVEEYLEFICDKKQLPSDFNNKAITVTDNYDFYVKRKLHIVNAAHTAIGFLGRKYNYRYVNETITDKIIEKTIRKMLEEIYLYFQENYQMKKNDFDNYVNITIKRFKNKKVIDEVERVARNPLTKLAYNERFLIPFKYLVDKKLKHEYLELIINTGFEYQNIKDKQSREMFERIEQRGKEELIKDVTHISNEEVIQGLL